MTVKKFQIKGAPILNALATMSSAIYPQQQFVRRSRHRNRFKMLSCQMPAMATSHGVYGAWYENNRGSCVAVVTVDIKQMCLKRAENSIKTRLIRRTKFTAAKFSLLYGVCCFHRATKLFSVDLKSLKSAASFNSTKSCKKQQKHSQPNRTRIYSPKL